MKAECSEAVQIQASPVTSAQAQQIIPTINNLRANVRKLPSNCALVATELECITEYKHAIIQCTDGSSERRHLCTAHMANAILENLAPS